MRVSSDSVNVVYGEYRDISDYQELPYNYNYSQSFSQKMDQSTQAKPSERESFFGDNIREASETFKRIFSKT